MVAALPCPLRRPGALAGWLRCVSMVVLSTCTGVAFAWSNHALNTWPAVRDMPELQRLAPVEVESLGAFLLAEAPRLEAVLDAEEQWARVHVPNYPPRPDALRFAAAGAQDAAELRRRFVAAVRIAPNLPLALFLQRLPDQPPDGRPALAPSAVSTLASDEVVGATPYVMLREGESVLPALVLTSSADEPDYGLDIGLWSDNGTDYGRRYGFGKQPFGNPALDFSSQAPFHMGFFHESAIIYAAASFLKRTFPEYRIHLWKTLAEHAFRTGHPYWGWRFTGWAAHYLQDLTQPYHARVLPGVSTLRMLWINTLDLAGWPGAKQRAITLVSNRHLALENFERTALSAAYAEPAGAAAVLFAALAGEGGGQAIAAGDRAGLAAEAPASLAATRPVYEDSTPRAVVSKRSAAAADAVDRAIAADLPPRYVDDPGFEFGVAGRGMDLYAQSGQGPTPWRAGALQVLPPLMSDFGSYTRALVRAILAAR